MVETLGRMFSGMLKTTDTSVRREEAKQYLIEREKVKQAEKNRQRETFEIERYAEERRMNALAVARAAKKLGVPPHPADVAFEAQLSKV